MRKKDERDQRKRIFVIGGGMAGLCAAWELSRPGEGQCEVVVFEQSWRLGGKGASGRRAHPSGAMVNVEHGLHMWSGLYRTAFGILREVYAEADRPQGTPLSTWRDAFEVAGPIAVFSEHPRLEGPWILKNPTNHALPGEGKRLYANFSAILLGGWRYFRGKSPSPAARDEDSRKGHGVRDLFPDANLFERLLFGTLGMVVGLAAWVLRRPELHVFLPVVERPSWWLLRLLRGPLTREGASVTQLRGWQLLNFGRAMIFGPSVDGARLHGMQSLNHLDFAEWIEPHLVPDGELTLRSPFVRFIYDAEFAFPGRMEEPRIAAGEAINVILEMAFAWRGSLLWTMKTGMGEGVFAPFYEALKKRGVRFAFNHQLTDVEVSDGAVSQLTFHETGVLRPGLDAYEPLVDCLGMKCWTHAPDPAQLLMTHVDEPVHVFDIGEDFDGVVMAIPVSALQYVRGNLVTRPKWRKALAAGKTVATCAAQVWLKSDGRCHWVEPMADTRPLVAGVTDRPLNTVADMSQVLASEGWTVPVDRLLYFCGPMPTAVEPAGEEAIHEYLDDLLVGSVEGAACRPFGDMELVEYSLHMNDKPADRFCLSLPGTIEDRIVPTVTGVSNLAVAGDWTRNGVNIGNMESAAYSGVKAACKFREMDVKPARSIKRMGSVRKMASRMADRVAARADAPKLIILLILGAILFAIVPTLMTVQKPPCAVSCGLLDGVGPPPAPDAFKGVSPWGYTVSLGLFLVPLLLLKGWELARAHKVDVAAAGATTFAVLFMGCVLDFVFADAFFRYPNADAVSGFYLYGLNAKVLELEFHELWAPFPVEEILFYGFGGGFMSMTYLWADQYWFLEYRDKRGEEHLLRGRERIKSRNWVFAWTVLLLLVGVGVDAVPGVEGGCPVYWSFLVLIGVLPHAWMAPRTAHLTNWRAFSFMYAALLFLSLGWEVSLGLPYGWWGYKPEYMLGLYFPGWSNLPLEGVFMWLVAAWAVASLFELLRERWSRPIER